MDTLVEDTQLYRQSIISYVYRITGSLEEAQDITQETILKYISQKTDEIHNPKAWMFKVATRLSLDLFKSARYRHESYKGPWLPEPYVEDSYTIEEELELDESLSMALLILMEKLSYKEKIAYILHDILEFKHDDVANILDTSVVNSRKLSSRAKKKLPLNKSPFKPTKQEHELLTYSFLQAIKKGNTSQLTQIFSDEIIFHNDGGGKATAAQKIIYGHTAVTQFIVKVISKNFIGNDKDLSIKTRWFNGSLGIVMLHKQTIVTSFQLEIHKNKISAIYALRNPDKLKFLE